MVTLCFLLHMKAAVASQRAALFCRGVRSRAVTSRRCASSRAVGVPVMAKLELAKTVDKSLPCIWPVLKSDVSDDKFLQEKVGPLAASWAKATNFKGESGKTAMVPGPDGSLAGVLLGLVWCLTIVSPFQHSLSVAGRNVSYQSNRNLAGRR